MIKGFYTGCVNSGNMGDDILFHIFIQMLCSSIKFKYKVECDVVQEKIKYDNNWMKDSIIGVVGGGSIIHPEEISYTIPIVNNKPKISMMFGTGITDSPKFKIPEDSRRSIILGNYSNINFPINDLMNYNIQAAQNSTHGGLRGPLDIIIAKKINKNFNKPYIYDPGLLAADFIKYDKLDPNDKMIGINLAYVTGDNRICMLEESYSQYMNRLESVITEFCQYVLNLNYSLYFYSMSAGEIQLHKKIIDRLTPQNKSTILYNKKELTASELLSVCSQFNIALATRLHANILANSVGVPTINLSYNFKAINYMESINMRKYAIPTNEELNTNNVINLFLNLLSENGKNENLFKYKNMASNMYSTNFTSILNNLNISFNKKIKIKYDILNNMLAIFEISSI